MDRDHNMDTTKIGGFLRELRKEKGLTQEQLADVFNVSARTVSRWETGSNMPDISILIEIADYYDLDVREILNGERKKIDPSDIRGIADYADKEKEKMALRTRIYAVAGIISMLVFVTCTSFAPDKLIFNLLRSVSLIFVYIALASSLIYTTERLQTLQRKFKASLLRNTVITILTIVGGILLFALVIPLFLIGSAS